MAIASLIAGMYELVSNLVIFRFGPVLMIVVGGHGLIAGDVFH